MVVIKRGFVKTYDENGKLISKVPVQESAPLVEELPVEEDDEVAEAGDE